MSITVEVPGKGTVRLDENNYMGGGQGRVYIKGDLAYKVYHDSDLAIPPGKIQELRVITTDHILGPIDPLQDPKSQQTVGFTMAFARDTVDLTCLIPTTYWTDHHLTPPLVGEIVTQIVEGTQFAHEKDVLLVDPNDMNFRVQGQEVFFIDVDNWQTPNYPAAAIQAALRDPLNKRFSVETDWYGIAVTTFKLWTGVHPFSGSHPDYSKRDLQKRMQDCASVFHPQAKAPAAARDFSIIPSAWQRWYERTFETAWRGLPPPLAATKATVPQKTLAPAMGKLTVTEVLTEPGIRRCYFLDGDLVCRADLADVISCEGRQLRVYLYNGAVVMSGDGYHTTGNISAQSLLVHENRVYARQRDKIIEVEVTSLGQRMVFSAGNVWDVLPYATRDLDGLWFSDLVGSPHLYIPYAKGKMAQLYVPELRGYRVVDGKHEKGIVVLFTVSSQGRTDRFLLNIDFKTLKYEVEVDEDAVQTAPNFTVMDKGLVVLLNGEDGLELFHKDRLRQKNILLDCGLTGYTLFSQGDQVHGYNQNQVVRITMV